MGGSSSFIRRWRVLAGVVAFLSPSAWADDEPTAKVVVIETYDGARPSDAAKHVGPLLEILERDGWAALPATVARVVGDRFPQPGRADPTMTIAKIRDKFAAAQRRATGKGFNFKEAIKLYEEGFRWVRDNEALVVTDLDARKWLTDAYVGYATALIGDSRRDDARAALRKQAMSFSDTPVTADHYGPDAAELYQAVRQELEAARHGSLLVTVADRADAYVSINNVGRGRGSSFEANVVAGDYDVLVQVGSSSLRYTVHANPSTEQHAELRIHWDLDSRFAIGDSWVGIDRAPADIVPALVRKLPDYGIVTISLADRGGRHWLIASRYPAGQDRDPVRCVAELGTQAETAIGPCLVGDVRLFSTVYSDVPGGSRSVVDGADGSPPARWPMWVAFGGAVTALGAGAVLLNADHACLEIGPAPEYNCARRRDTLIPAVVSLSVSAGSLAFMTYSYLHYVHAMQRRRPRAIVGVEVGGAGGMLTVSGVFR